jgi:ribosome production factor 1
MEEAIKRDYTHVLRLQEFQNEPYAMDICMLPEGPTVSFRIRKYIPCKDIYNRGVPILTQPEMIFKNFTTSFGKRVERFFNSMFPPQPKLKDRTIISMINQRDFIFFRHHR